MGGYNRERAARVLVDASFYGDQAAAKRAGLHERTIDNYRRYMAEDAELARLFAEKKRLFEASWASELPAAIRACIAFFVRAAQEGNPRDPEMVHAVAGAFKLVTDAGFAKAILDVKLAEHGQLLGEYGEPVAGAIAETSEGDA